MLVFQLLEVLAVIWASQLAATTRHGNQGCKDRITLKTLSGSFSILRDGMRKISDLRGRLKEKYKSDVKLFRNGKPLDDDESMGDPILANIAVVVPIRGGMRVQVQTMLGENVDVEVEPNETVLDLKKKLSKKQKLPVEQQRIIYEGKMMQDSKTLADYNIKNNSVIHMVLRLRGGEEEIHGDPKTENRTHRYVLKRN